MPPPLLGLGLALAAAAGNNLGKGLQKAATQHLPQLDMARGEGILAPAPAAAAAAVQLLGADGEVAFWSALAAAPVSLVQPVAAFGLVLLAGFSHFVLQAFEQKCC
ncbi:hypothetical protein COO60DRAFT_1642000 [Scenedesmus sp. NREL 46B-D3]|nr:hypothetical protein COO60DRAFT_1642000 [Scenedesmus sp. NREL 46B-D3]